MDKDSDSAPESSCLIGVISDTHGLVRTSALKALQGVSMIIHAGDVGSPQVLDELRLVAPVVAVRGNMDGGPWAADLPGTEVVRVCSISIYVLHDVQHLPLDPARSGFDVVISGHSHRPSVSKRKSVLFVNPGSAGPRRFRLPVSLALLRVDGAVVVPEIIEIER